MTGTPLLKSSPYVQGRMGSPPLPSKCRVIKPIRAGEDGGGRNTGPATENRAHACGGGWAEGLEGQEVEASRPYVRGRMAGRDERRGE